MIRMKIQCCLWAAIFLFVGCDSKATSKNTLTEKCPDVAVYDSTSTGEYDPIASLDAVPCGTMSLWGASMPKSFNMWQEIGRAHV